MSLNFNLLVRLMKSILYSIFFFSVSLFANVDKNIKIEIGEKWWGAVTSLGINMPYSINYEIIDLHNNYSNQCVPLLVSNKGRYIWSDNPFSFRFDEDQIIISSESEVVLNQSGKTMKSAFKDAASNFFHLSGKMPSELFITVPQYNTWIELMYNQNQNDILKYARSIISNGFPAGVFMIDDNWQKYYGNFEFKKEAFPEPKKMIDELHNMGFKVMLWISPYVSPDSKEYRFLKDNSFLIKEKNKNVPAIFDWWNGRSACYDLSNPNAYDYFLTTLKNMQKDYGIDGFKFDGGDSKAYNSELIDVFDKKSYGNAQSELWAKLGTMFEYNEYRACWKMSGQPLVQRLCDKSYSWNDLQKLIPDMLACGILGHPYTCPDMIGGGEFKSFINVNPENVDQKLLVRSCQVHALMPMMQFSVAPWRILDSNHLDIIKHYVNLHKEYANYILELASNASKTGEPIVRYMEYEFPNQGFENCQDQFMLGHKILVAPILDKSDRRYVHLPKGVWLDDMGNKFIGPRIIQIEAGIRRLPFYRLM